MSFLTVISRWSGIKYPQCCAEANQRQTELRADHLTLESFCNDLLFHHLEQPVIGHHSVWGIYTRHCNAAFDRLLRPVKISQQIPKRQQGIFTRICEMVPGVCQTLVKKKTPT